MTMHILAGGTALSAFRVARLVAQLQAYAPELSGLEVREFFLVHGDVPDPVALHRLLGAGAGSIPEGPGRLFVVPRLGTLSPWSSKATDIARVCGLDGVRRVESGRLLLLQGVDAVPPSAWRVLHDPMTESVVTDEAALASVFATPQKRALRTVDVTGGGAPSLQRANTEWGLALSDDEIEYLAAHFRAVGRNPSDAELMMFAQINSEHCRHKIFNADFTVDGQAQPHSLFAMIKHSHAAAPDGVLMAYADNAAVVQGHEAERFFAQPDRHYGATREPVHLLMKVETHNHPTGISPHPGAGTGAGGEIRDEAATGRGGKPKAGLCGFSTSHLRIPGWPQPWDRDDPLPLRMAPALDIMLEGPIGAAAYNNEFGRPNLAGYFRTFEQQLPDGDRVGYHKPIMIAGGYGNIRADHVLKQAVAVDATLVVLGGPAMLIGLGGGAASSMATGASTEALDFASVQRANPELERRCQEVIDRCWALGADNPIVSIHDVGAGGLSNALPELIDADGRGGCIRLRAIHCADPSLSPMEIWCNEAQERYVLAVGESGLQRLVAECERERCPYAVVGRAQAEPQLQVEDDDGSRPVDMPMPVLLGKAPRMHRKTVRQPRILPAFDISGLDVAEAAAYVLQFPAVAAKTFLITIGDRTVGGLTVRDQMVGPWQVPVADCAVTATGFTATTGEAMAMGERTPLALLDAPASGRMAVAEAVTNIAAAGIDRLGDVRLSANWMAAAGHGDEDARLYDTVRAVGAELCPQLGIAIPVGKDSLSMRTVWEHEGRHYAQNAPLSLIVSAFAPVADVRRTLTPQLHTAEPTRLLLVDLGNGRNRLGGSVLAQAFGQLGGATPDLDDPQQLKRAFDAVQSLNRDGRLLAYHDRSDGGLLAVLCEMAFAGHCGVDVTLDAMGDDPVGALFAEELGMVLQVRAADAAAVLEVLHAQHLEACDVGAPATHDRIVFCYRERALLDEPREQLHKLWAETSYRMQSLRDDPECAREEFEATGDPADPGLQMHLTFDPSPGASLPSRVSRPKVAILREQGVNGQTEMAYAFHAAGFDAVDVHMSDILCGRDVLEDYAGVVACGGFSYGDVLGAGQGWARSILFNPRAREVFQHFLAREDRFALGVCNGCQMFAALSELVPGSEHWPRMERNRSEQFEARWSLVEIPESRSLFFAGMGGSRLPVAVAHGEGRAAFYDAADGEALAAAGQVAMRFIDHTGAPAARYPANPNGSPAGITGFCNADGRVTLLMPHPERTVAGVTGSWWPRRWQAHTPWLQMFVNARRWVRQ